jgi:hypothetical protein
MPSGLGLGIRTNWRRGLQLSKLVLLPHVLTRFLKQPIQLFLQKLNFVTLTLCPPPLRDTLSTQARMTGPKQDTNEAINGRRIMILVKSIIQ